MRYTLYIQYIVFILNSIEYMSKKDKKVSHYVLFKFYTSSQLFWNWGCILFYCHLYCSIRENVAERMRMEKMRSGASLRYLGEVADEMATFAVILGQDVEEEGLHIVVEGLVVQEQLGQQTQVLTVDCAHIPINLWWD